MLFIAGNTVAFLGSAAIVWCAGFALERRLFGYRLPADLRQLTRFCLGLGFWIVSAFALAVAGGLSAAAVAVLGAAAVVSAFVEWRRAEPRTSGAAGENRPAADPWPAVVMTLLAAPLFLLALSPAISWDANTYHLTLPRLFAEHGGFRPVELNVYANWPLNVELLFTLAMVIRGYVLAKLVHFGFGLLTLVAIHVACRGFGYRAAGPLAGLLFLANQVVLFEFTVAYVDLAYAFFFLAAFVFALRSNERGPTATPCLCLAGLCAGLMAGVKPNGVVGAVIVGLFLLPQLLAAARSGTLAAAVRRSGLAYALPVVLLTAPWLVRSAWTTNNPVYPLAWSVFGGPDWSAELSRQLEAWQRGIGMGREPLDYLLLPVRMFLHGGDTYDRFSGAVGSFWLVAIPLACLFVRVGPVRNTLLVAGAWFLIWAATSQQMRLFIPALPFLAVATAVAIHAGIEKLRPPGLRTMLRRVAPAAGLILVAAYGGHTLRAGLGEAKHLAGFRGDPVAATVPDVFRVIDRELPSNAKLLFVNTNHGFHCPREFVADSFFEASQIADWLKPAGTTDDVGRLLARRNITHLLVEGHDWGIDYPPAFLRFLRDPDHVAVLYRSPDLRYTLLERLSDAL